MKIKHFLLRLVCIASSAALLLICTGCAGTTANTGNKYDIGFTAEYNEKENTVDTVISNNTEKYAVMYDGVRSIYKESNGKWCEVPLGEYTTYATLSAIFPEENNNTASLSFPAYKTAGENINVNAERESLPESGKYKITTRVYVYDTDEYTTVPQEEGFKKYIDPDSPHENVELEAEFIV